MMPWNIKVSTVFNYQSGKAYDRHAWIRLPNFSWTQIIAEPASYNQRFPDQYLWDLSVGKHFTFAKGYKVSLDVQILNLLNDDATEGWQTREFAGSENPIPDLWVLPRRAELRLRLEF
jgi:hypothetical protein